MGSFMNGHVGPSEGSLVQAATSPGFRAHWVLGAQSQTFDGPSLKDKWQNTSLTALHHTTLHDEPQLENSRSRLWKPIGAQELSRDSNAGTNSNARYEDRRETPHGSSTRKHDTRMSQVSLISGECRWLRLRLRG